MASLEVQYKSWLKENKGSDFTFEDWKKYIMEPKFKIAAEQIKISREKIAGIDLNSVDLRDLADQEYYLTEDVVIPKGSRIENWSKEQKNDFNRFEMIVSFGKNCAIPFRIYPDELEDIIKENPQLICNNKI